MYYRDLTRPHLWPTATLLEARYEIVDALDYARTGPSIRAELTALLPKIDAVLDARRVSLKSRNPPR